jgi:hypothetical protein
MIQFTRDWIAANYPGLSFKEVLLLLKNLPGFTREKTIPDDD